MEPAVSPGVEPPTILVTTTTWWPSVAILASSLERTGFHVVLLCPKGHVGHQALHFRCLTLDRSRPVASLADAIRTVSPSFVVPGDDRAVAQLVHLGRDAALRAVVARSLGPDFFHPALTERVALLQVAEAVGLAVPAHRLLPTRGDLHRWLDGVAAPWVLKADGAWGGEGVAIASSREAADRAFGSLGHGPSQATIWWRALVKGDPFWLHDKRLYRRRPVSVQTFVAGRPGTCALFAHEGAVLGATIMEAQATHGGKGPSTVLQPVDRPEFLRGAERLVARLRLSGFFGLDFMVEETTGRAVLIEMNPRITSPARMRGPFGIDPVRASAEFYGCASPETASTPREHFASFPLAWLTDPFARELRHCDDDCPWHEPLMLRASLQTLWPERGMLAALPSRLRTWMHAVTRKHPVADYRNRPIAWWTGQRLLRSPDGPDLPPVQPATRQDGFAVHDPQGASG